MDHLSEAEIFDFVDRRMAPDMEREAQAHCAMCARCRQRVDFNRALARKAAEPIQGALSDGFIERVMKKAHAAERAPRFSWILQNSSNIIALAVVLAILAAVGYVAARQPDASAVDTGTSALKTMGAAWTGLSSSLSSLFAQHAAEAMTPIVTQGEKIFGNVFWLGAAAFILLALADRIRLRMKMTTMLPR